MRRIAVPDTGIENLFGSYDENLRHFEHVLNVRAKLSKDEDSQMRMVKKAPDRKIDLDQGVAAELHARGAVLVEVDDVGAGHDAGACRGERITRDR